MQVHYIMEKPWAHRPDSPSAPKQDLFLSRWWWAEYEAMASEWKGKKELAAIEKNVASQVLMERKGSVNGDANADVQTSSEEEQK